MTQTLPKPFYEDSLAVVYNTDCLELVAALSQEAKIAIVSDPPYGVRINTNHAKGPRGKVKVDGKSFATVLGNDELFDPSPWLQFDHVLMWGANHYCWELPSKPGRWLIWDKRCGVIPERQQADCEIAWCNTYGAARVFRHVWDGMVKDSERGQSRVHPTQKPVSLMAWCLQFIPESYTIVDPYMGSGTTLVACKEMGRRCIGIEMSVEYCEAAAKRLSQGTLWEMLPNSLLDGKPLQSEIK